MWLLLYVFLLKSSPQSKFIFACINTYLELQQIGCNQAEYVGRDTCLELLSPVGKSSASLGMSVSDLRCGMGVSDPRHGMASRKSHVSELENWMPRHLKKPSVRIKLRAGGDLNRSEKSEQSVGDMVSHDQKKCIGIQFLPREFYCQFF